MAVCFQPFVPELFGLHIGCALALNFVRRKHNVIVHGHKGIPGIQKECINNPESLHSDLVEAGCAGRGAKRHSRLPPQGEYFSPVPDVAGVLCPGGLRLESKDNLSRPGAQFI